jgi:putative flippase GtrA
MAGNRGCSMSALAQSFIALFREVRGVRFLVMGGLNTLFGFLSYSLAIWLWGEIWLALLISNVTGVVCNFLTMGGLVFRDLGLARLPRFVLVYLAIYLINWGCIELLMGFIATSKILAQAGLVVPMALMSYVFLSNYVFRRDLSS